jgi:hypothetical protein
MDLLKQAFDNIERTVDAASATVLSTVVESASEFPKPADPAFPAARAAKKLHVSSAGSNTASNPAQHIVQDMLLQLLQQQHSSSSYLRVHIWSVQLLSSTSSPAPPLGPPDLGSLISSVHVLELQLLSIRPRKLRHHGRSLIGR